MRQLFIQDKVVLYIESDEQLGTLHNLTNEARAYINADMVEIIQHLIKGNNLNSFFPNELPERDELVKQSELAVQQLIAAGFLSETKPDQQGLVKRVQSKPPLRVVFIELTKKCNLRCRHCYVPDCSDSNIKPANRQITHDDISRLIAQADNLGVMELQFTGGEPFILPYALDIIKDAQRRLIPCSIFTNGTMITESIFDYIDSHSFGLIFYVSLDGFQETHDTFRRSKGAFQAASKSIKRLIGMGCDVRINTSIGRHNVDEIRQFIEFVKGEFNTLHRLVTIEPIGRADSEMTIGPHEFADLLQEKHSTIEFLDSHDSIADWSTPACGIGSSMLFVDAYGNVSFCPTLTQREDPTFLAGNVKHASLKEIWEESPVFNKHRDFQCEEIEQCHFRELCKGGCRSRAYLSSGNLSSPDRAMCLMYNAH